MTTPELVDCELVVHTSNGDFRQPIRVVVNGHNVSIGEGVTLSPVDAFTTIHGLEVEMPVAEWLRITEAQTPGLRLHAEGVSAITVISNVQVLPLRPGDSITVADGTPPPSEPADPDDGPET